jgi:predicted DNA-binding ribbon-helix-helix protein
VTAADRARPVKRSLTLSGHRTSVTLEPPFWLTLERMAAEGGLSLNALAGRIDAARAPGAGLASALRVAALDWALDGALDGAPERTPAPERAP